MANVHKAHKKQNNFRHYLISFDRLSMSITVDHISKSYGTQLALNAVSFRAQKGEIVGLLGPNGAGKSTLMKILTTSLRADGGTAIVNQYDVLKQAQRVRESIGYLPEHNPLYPEMYVKEYLRFVARFYGAAKEDVTRVIEQTGLIPEQHKRIGQLSKGYRQRVGLAAALVHDPDVLILDEPTTGLDPNQLIEIRELIRKVGQHKTVLLSTHIMQEVEAICDRVIIINKGELVLDRSLEELSSGQQQIIEVEFDYRVEEELIGRMKGVEKVENSVGFVYQVYCTSDKDMRPAIFDFAHDNGLKILQLHQKNHSLEQLFVELTTQK